MKPNMNGDPNIDELKKQIIITVSENNVKRVNKLITGEYGGLIITAKNSKGQNLLYTACINGYKKIVDLMLKKGLSPNEKCDEGSSSMHAAAYNCSVSILIMLLKCGGDLRLRDNLGRTPEDWAKRQPTLEDKTKMLKAFSLLRRMNYLLLSDEILKSIENAQTQQEQLILINQNYDEVKTIALKLGKNKCKGFLPFSANFGICNFGFGKVNLQRIFKGHTMLDGCVLLVCQIDLKHDELGPTYTNCVFIVMEAMLFKVQPVTVKRLHSKFYKSSRLDLLYWDLNYLKAIRHPNILQLIGVCHPKEFDGMYILFERINLGSLNFYLHKNAKRLTLEQVCDSFSQLCVALSYLHECCSTIHMSITSHAVQLIAEKYHNQISQNLFNVKLSNFEFAKPVSKIIQTRDTKSGRNPSLERKNERIMRADDIANTTLPLDNKIFSKWAFKYPDPVFRTMAPELLLGHEATFRADIFSLSAVMCEALTGNEPFTNLSPSEIYTARIRQQRNVNFSSLTQPWIGLLRKGLAINPNDRYLSMDELKLLLDVVFSEHMRKPKDELLASTGVSRPHVTVDLNPKTVINDSPQIKSGRDSESGETKEHTSILKKLNQTDTSKDIGKEFIMESNKCQLINNQEINEMEISDTKKMAPLGKISPIVSNDDVENEKIKNIISLEDVKLETKTLLPNANIILPVLDIKSYFGKEDYSTKDHVFLDHEFKASESPISNDERKYIDEDMSQDDTENFIDNSRHISPIKTLNNENPFNNVKFQQESVEMLNKLPPLKRYCTAVHLSDTKVASCKTNTTLPNLYSTIIDQTSDNTSNQPTSSTIVQADKLSTKEENEMNISPTFLPTFGIDLNELKQTLAHRSYPSIYDGLDDMRSGIAGGIKIEVWSQENLDKINIDKSNNSNAHNCHPLKDIYNSIKLRYSNFSLINKSNSENILNIIPNSTFSNIKAYSTNYLNVFENNICNENNNNDSNFENIQKNTMEVNYGYNDKPSITYKRKGIMSGNSNNSNFLKPIYDDDKNFDNILVSQIKDTHFNHYQISDKYLNNNNNSNIYNVDRNNIEEFKFDNLSEMISVRNKCCNFISPSPYERISSSHRKAVNYNEKFMEFDTQYETLNSLSESSIDNDEVMISKDSYLDDDFKHSTLLSNDNLGFTDPSNYFQGNKSERRILSDENLMSGPLQSVEIISDQEGRHCVRLNHVDPLTNTPYHTEQEFFAQTFQLLLKTD